MQDIDVAFLVVALAFGGILFLYLRVTSFAIKIGGFDGLLVSLFCILFSVWLLFRVFGLPQFLEGIG
jgi:hypothetical protein